MLIVPDSKEILTSQIDALVRDLARTQDLLKTIPTGFDRKVHDRAVGTFEGLIRDERTKLTELRAKADTSDELSQLWKALPEISTRASAVFGESLAFLQGALARASKLDNQLCLIADALLDELSTRSGVSWERFTILAPGELYAGMADIIRVRFPDTSVWSLPVVAHEFGHFAGPALTVKDAEGTTHPFEELVKREEQRRWQPRHVHELFADVFAAYTIGPAYAFTCIAGRFDPSDPYRDRSTHPAPAKRAHAVLSTLRWIEQEGGPGSAFGNVERELTDAWSALVAGAGHPAGLADVVGDDAVADLDRLVTELHGLVEKLNPGAMYGYERFLAAQQLANALRSTIESGTESLPALGEDVQLADILNGGWLARWRWDWKGQFGRTVFALCERLRVARAARP